jgi:hypothetical protein
MNPLSSHVARHMQARPVFCNIRLDGIKKRRAGLIAHEEKCTGWNQSVNE